MSSYKRRAEVQHAFRHNPCSEQRLGPHLGQLQAPQQTAVIPLQRPTVVDEKSSWRSVLFARVKLREGIAGKPTIKEPR